MTNTIFQPKKIAAAVSSIALFGACTWITFQPVVGTIQDYATYFFLAYFILLAVVFYRRKSIPNVASGFISGFVLILVAYGVYFATVSIFLR